MEYLEYFQFIVYYNLEKANKVSVLLSHRASILIFLMPKWRTLKTRKDLDILVDKQILHMCSISLSATPWLVGL